MVGIIDAGGGLRGVYGAGILDFCLENGIQFDYCIGVSAGSANLAAYLAKQRGRNYRFYAEYAFRKAYMSARNFFRKSGYIDLEYVYGTLANEDGEDPLHYREIAASDKILKVVATNAQTGKPHYFEKEDMQQNDYRIMMASSCIPLVCRPYVLNGIPYYDGGISDPIPVQKAFDDGCDRVVVILTRPLSMPREEKTDAMAARLLRRKFPQAAEALRLRYQTYNRAVALAQSYAKQGKALVIAPDSLCGMKTLTKDRACIDRMYQKGQKDARKIVQFLAFL